MRTGLPRSEGWAIVLKKNNLAFREAFFAGRLGIRGKILIYLAILAGFIISAVWMLQGVLVYSVSRGLNMPPQLLTAVQTQFFLTVGVILLATGLRIAKVKDYPVADMIPAMILVWPVSAAWTAWILPLLG